MSTFGPSPNMSSCAPGNLLDELQSGRFPMFSTLVEAARYAGALELLEQDGITVLCPTNDAFAREGITITLDTHGILFTRKCTMCGNDLHKVIMKPDEVADVLTQHIIPQRIPQLRGHHEIKTMKSPLYLDHDMDMRTMVRTKNGKAACVLMQGFVSTNAAFAAIGRVLL